MGVAPGNFDPCLILFPKAKQIKLKQQMAVKAQYIIYISTRRRNQGKGRTVKHHLYFFFLQKVQETQFFTK